MPFSQAAEIEKFNERADRWWDPEGPFGPLHRIQPLRLDYIRSVAPLVDQRALDVGSGGGLLAEGLARVGAYVTGVEPGEAAIEAARAHLRVSGLEVTYRQGEIAHFSAEEIGPFDLITCMEVLEHVPDPGELVKQCTNLLKPGGLFFFATLNRTVQSYLFAILGAEYILGWLPAGTHDWDRFITPGEMETYLRKAGIQAEDIQGMVYNPLSNTFRLSSDVGVNYLGYGKKVGVSHL